VRGAIFIHQIKMIGSRIKIYNHIVPMFPPYRVSSFLFFHVFRIIFTLSWMKRTLTNIPPLSTMIWLPLPQLQLILCFPLILQFIRGTKWLEIQEFESLVVSIIHIFAAVYGQYLKLWPMCIHIFYHGHRCSNAPSQFSSHSTQN